MRQLGVCAHAFNMWPSFKWTNAQIPPTISMLLVDPSPFRSVPYSRPLYATAPRLGWLFMQHALLSSYNKSIQINLMLTYFDFKQLPTKPNDDDVASTFHSLVVCFYNAMENEAHFVLECVSLLYNPIMGKFFIKMWGCSLREPWVFLSAELWVDICLHLMEVTALCHSEELVALKPSWCIFNFVSLLASRTQKSIPFHFSSHVR